MNPRDLKFVYQGWDGYHTSLAKAVAHLTKEHMAFRAVPDMRSVAELAWHIGDGRVQWFRRIGAPTSDALFDEMESRSLSEEAILDAEGVAEWLDKTWNMVEATLAQWTVDDLPVTFIHPYEGKTYAVSRQWVVWRIMGHDIHHGGQLSELLAMKGILPLELTLLGGHLTEPDLV